MHASFLQCHTAMAPWCLYSPIYPTLMCHRFGFLYQHCMTTHLFSCQDARLRARFLNGMFVLQHKQQNLLVACSSYKPVFLTQTYAIYSLTFTICFRYYNGIYLCQNHDGFACCNTFLCLLPGNSFNVSAAITSLSSFLLFYSLFSTLTVSC